MICSSVIHDCVEGDGGQSPHLSLGSSVRHSGFVFVVVLEFLDVYVFFEVRL